MSYSSLGRTSSFYQFPSEERIAECLRLQKRTPPELSPDSEEIERIDKTAARILANTSVSERGMRMAAEAAVYEDHVVSGFPQSSSSCSPRTWVVDEKRNTLSGFRNAAVKENVPFLVETPVAPTAA